jgi:hypothetical protein
MPAVQPSSTAYSGQAALDKKGYVGEAAQDLIVYLGEPRPGDLGYPPIRTWINELERRVRRDVTINEESKRRRR